MYIKFPVGSGTFKRTKYVYVHFVGPKCGIVKRGKWNAELGNVLRLFNAPSGVEVDTKDVLSFDYLVSQLKKVFVSDDGSFSVQQVKDEYNRRLAEEHHRHLDTEERPLSPIRQRKLAVELGLTAESVLKAIREDIGPFNWATFEPNTKAAVLIEGGSNGIFELAEHLPEDKICFGLLRLSFGTGRFRRVKRVFFQWSGDNVGAVAKGKANMLFGDMAKLLAPHNAELRLVGRNDLQPDAIINKVRSIFVIDNIEVPVGDGKVRKAALTTEEYIHSLLEEQEKVREFYNEPADAGSSPSGPQTLNVEETIQLIQKPEGGLVWGIFQFKS
jgi:hypothetical protein